MYTIFFSDLKGDRDMTVDNLTLILTNHQQKTKLIPKCVKSHIKILSTLWSSANL